MGTVVKFYPANAADDPDMVLERAQGAYASVLVLGRTPDGELDARASMNLSDEEVLWLMEQFKARLLSGEFEA